VYKEDWTQNYNPRGTSHTFSMSHSLGRPAAIAGRTGLYILPRYATFFLFFAA